MNRFFNKQKYNKTVEQRKIVIDTNGLIDGRIIDVVKAGFVPENIILPQFVVAELQYLADKGDAQKRERARFGLDVARELQELPGTKVTIAREKFPNIKEVDDKLVALAKQYHAPLYTIDYNLNKVAQIEGVTVLNVNELAQALRPHNLPGEKATVKLVQPGQDSHQAVGYLEDGTMVVVENGRKHIGQKVGITFTRMLQTQAGKMSFATIDQPPKGGGGQHSQQQPEAAPKNQDQKQNQDQNQNQKQKQGSQQQHAQPKKSGQKHGNGQRQPKGKPQQQQGKQRRKQQGGKQNPEDKLLSLVNENDS